MPRFYFDFDDHRDDDGIEFESLEQAIAEAHETLPVMAEGVEAPKLGQTRGWFCDISDEKRTPLCRVTLCTRVEGLVATAKP